MTALQPVRDLPSAVRRLLVCLIAVALVVYPMNAPLAQADHNDLEHSDDAACTPVYDQVGNPTGTYFCTGDDISLRHNTSLIQTLFEGDYAITEAQYRALKTLERQALANTAATHGVSPDETEQLLWYARSELRAELLGLLVAAANKPVHARTADEVTALEWLGEVQQRQNVTAAQAAIDEYVKFYGETAFQQGEYPRNACTYTPPAPFESEYPGDAGRWIGCFTQPGPLDQGPRIPSQDDFTRWGLAAVQAERATAGGTVLTGTASQFAIALAAAGGTTATVTSALVGLNAATAGLVSQALVPFASRVAFAPAMAALNLVPASQQSFAPLGVKLVETAASSASSAANAAVAQATGMSAGTVLGAAAIVLVSLTLVVMSIIRVVNNNQVGPKLQEALQRARDTAVDPVAMLGTAEGVATAMLAVQAASTTTAFEGATPPAAPAARDGDPVLRITTSTGDPVENRTDRVRYLGTGPEGLVDNTRIARGGWWLAPEENSDPAINLILPLWDEHPNVSSGVATDRPGFSWDATVSSVVVDGQRKFLATAVDRPGYPIAGSGCDDYDSDGCLLTDRLPYLHPSGGTIPDKRYLEYVPNAAPVPFAIEQSPASPAQRQQVVFSAAATDASQQLGTDADGDPVTVTWTVAWNSIAVDPCAGCPERAPQTGPTAAFEFDSWGTYTVRATARDPFGAARVATRAVQVGNAAPVLALDPAPAAVQLFATYRVRGTVTDGRHEPVAVRVDWGDGSPVEDGVTSSFPRIDVGHDYQRPGSYTVTVTASDRGEFGSYPLTSTSTRVVRVDKLPGSVSITNIPTGAVFGGSFTPAFAKAGDGVVAVTARTPGVCSVSTFGVVSFDAAGTCTLQASVREGTNHLAATGPEQSFEIAKAAGSVRIDNIPGDAVFKGSFTPTYLKAGDGLATTSSKTPSVCSVAFGVVYFDAAGTCTLQASVAEGTNHLAATGPEQHFAVAGFTFTGFAAPISNGFVNGAKAGQAIPVKYRLSWPDGTPVSDPVSFTSLKSQSGGGLCAGLPLDPIEAYAAGDSGLRYLGDGNWQFNWKTPKDFAGQCRSMTLTLEDGSTHTATFQFM